MTRAKLLFLVLAVGLLAMWVYKEKIEPTHRDYVLQNILESPYAQGKINDFLNEYKIESADDVAYYVDENDILYVQYGNQEFELPLVQLTKDMAEKLKAVGLEVFKNKKTGKIIVKYKGEEVKQWIIKDGALPS